MEMENPMFKQMMEMQTQMLSTMQAMQSQTLTVIQQNTAALQNNQTSGLALSHNQNQPVNVMSSGVNQVSANTNAPLGEPPTPFNAQFLNAPPSISNTVASLFPSGVMPNMAPPSPAPVVEVTPGNFSVAPPNSLASVTGMNAMQMYNQFNNQKGYTQEVTRTIYDPREYSSYSLNPVANPLNYFIKSHMDFKGYQASVESQQEFVIGTSNRLTENVMGAFGSVTTGLGNIAGFAIPGVGLLGGMSGIGMLGAGAAGIGVGMITKMAVDEIIKGGKLSAQYEDILRKKEYTFLNPFESTNEFGRVGFKRSEQHEISEYMRKLAPEKFLEDEQLQQILMGATENKLLKGVNDVDSFKKKFTETVDTVKKIMVTMDQSIEEATAFMGEMERRGISMGMMNNISANVKMASSFGMMSVSEGQQRILSTVDAVTQGTAVSADASFRTSSFNISTSNLLYDNFLVQDEYMKNYVKNRGGATQVGQDLEVGFRGAINQNAGLYTSLLASAFEKDEQGRFVVNDAKMRDLMSGRYTTSELQASAQGYMSTLSAADKVKLMESSGTALQNYANSGQELSGLIQMLIGEFKKTMPAGTDNATALRISGIARTQEEAELMSKTLDYQLDPKVQDALTAKMFQTEMNSTVEPGYLDKVKFKSRELRADILGDIGQSIYNTTSDKLVSINSYLENIPDRSVSGFYYDLADKNLVNDTYSKEGASAINESFQYMQQYTRERKSRFNDVRENANTQGFFADVMGFDSRGETYDIRVGVNANSPTYKSEELSHFGFDRMMTSAEEGTITNQDLDRLQEYAAGGFGEATQKRAQYILTSIETGEFKKDKFYNFNDFYDQSQDFEETYNASTGKNEKADSEGVGSTIAQTKETLDTMKKELLEQGKMLTKDIKKFFVTDAITNKDEVEKAIREGDVQKVSELTNGSAEGVRLANEYADYNKGVELAVAAGKEIQDEDKVAESLANTGVNLSSFLSTLSIDDAKERTKPLAKMAEDLKDGLTDSGIFDGLDGVRSMTSQELKEQSDAVKSEIVSVFSDMDEVDRLVATKQLISQDRNASMDMFTDEKGVISAEKLADYWMKTSANQQAAQEGVMGEGDKETTGTIKAHEETMQQLTSSLQSEMQMMRAVMEGRSVPKTTSPSTP